MARHVWLLLCLIGLATTTVFATNPTVYVQIGKKLLLEHVGNKDELDITSCDLILNNGTKINLYSKSHDVPRSDRYELQGYQMCNTKIWNMNKDDGGKWSVETTFKKKGSKDTETKRKTYNVEVRKMYNKKAAVPSGRVWVYPDQLVSVHFSETFTNLKSCKLLNSEKMEYDLGSESSANIQKLGHCGFKMTAKENYGGKWMLLADLSNDTAFYIETEVLLKNPEDLRPEPMKFEFKRGEDASFSLKFNNQKPRMCYIEDPHGEKYPIQDGGCGHELGVATEYHKGLWKAFYGFEGMEKLVERHIHIEIQEDVPIFKSNVIRSNDGDINLICQVRASSLKYCSFIRPDGEILHMTIGVGNNKYEYYGNGTNEHESWLWEHESTIDCGVTIHKPEAHDFGSWKCLVKTDKRKTFGTVLKVASSAKSRLIPRKTTTTSKDIYVKRGESYTIKCKTDEVLSYCWLRSPNGTVHSVVDAKKPKAPALKYEGEGLELGDCTAVVKDANDTHNGQWTCHMGVANGPEIEAKLNVIVTDTHLIAASETVLLDSHSETDLICRPLPGSTKVIEACRWVNPLGHGINVDHEGRYYTVTGTTHCKLSIRVINYEEDVGNWSCYARFAKSHKEEEEEEEEGVARIIVIYRTGFGFGSLLSVALCASSLVILSIGIFVIVVYRRRLAALRNLDEKIILEKPSKFP